ncbi:MAG TPA: nicotinamide-nucleotide amidohydrolase family protein, partial [Clostridia bacterium]|nr:nicotinamide-nucleotide amidohydrolase family protein [Clostridia bacterium]
EAEKLIRPVEEAIRRRLGDYLFGQDEDTIEEAVARLLWQQGLTVAVAESCSGGLLAHRLTNVSGSSAYFQLGTVVYHNQWKEELLGVPGEVLAARGAVSPEVAEAMARGVRARAGTDIGIGITGIAGPLGGTPEKPVGLVYLGMDFRGRVKVWRENWTGSRLDIKWLTSQWALVKLYQTLRRGDLPE